MTSALQRRTHLTAPRSVATGADSAPGAADASDCAIGLEQIANNLTMLLRLGQPSGMFGAAPGRALVGGNDAAAMSQRVSRQLHAMTWGAPPGVTESLFAQVDNLLRLVGHMMAQNTPFTPAVKEKAGAALDAFVAFADSGLAGGAPVVEQTIAFLEHVAGRSALARQPAFPAMPW